MVRNQVSFFATKADLETLLRAIESKRQVQYVVTGLFDSPRIEPIPSLLTVPDLGYLTTGDQNQATGYLVAARETSIKFEPVPQRRGGVKYAVDQLANPTTVAFRPGGAFGEKCLIAGDVGTATDDLSSLQLFRLFCDELSRQFTKIQSDYVGRDAGKLLDRGWRLTANAKSPPIYDLKRD